MTLHYVQVVGKMPHGLYVKNSPMLNQVFGGLYKDILLGHPFSLYAAKLVKTELTRG